MSFFPFLSSCTKVSFSFDLPCESQNFFLANLGPGYFVQAMGYGATRLFFLLKFRAGKFTQKIFPPPPSKLNGRPLNTGSLSTLSPGPMSGVLVRESLPLFACSLYCMTYYVHTVNSVFMFLYIFKRAHCKLALVVNGSPSLNKDY